ncbi:Lipoamide acyltransferase component of branched-chain alpha-keto acid dehydrogenase complex-like protein [Hapsidospora chrysogenum ATCC 11550]|uniref:Dihydrolipoamide acetyltransferase component of pyruvate dehydrogenase complex n=1 Tax=Hapsidospora chrysogenum (strain ATCC 11550 / CBS 779.69 / DSM 880 / IAM 14645 / JCM 23072 / IMI 49137) TaxID=857340 RepID=A0A086T6N8_HAPC1|nr:Lipoamide acyltransferase component of branched-chain alpha-keto acid dehydrogenase complex-like protein [Hapsidospora chrysogenum ATCC 11550]
MFLQRGSRVLQRQWRTSKAMGQLMAGRGQAASCPARWFTESRRLMAVKPVVLADIGEGIVECEVIQWFVEPGAAVEEFSPLCEVQSDKASVEITSRFTGTVTKLYYEAGEMARVGKPFVDIDIQGDAKSVDIEALTAAPEQGKEEEPMTAAPPSAPQNPVAPQPAKVAEAPAPVSEPKPKGKCAALATPAVRHLSKELKVDILDIEGTGRDGRVLKEDIYKFVQARDAGTSAPGPAAAAQSAPASATATAPADTSVQTETRVPLTNIQQQMFKSMTRSLNIPHFLYTDEIDFSSLVELRGRLNRVLAKSPETKEGMQQISKLSYLPFIIKAVSLALYKFPILNARVDADPSTGKPSLVHRSQHNIGVAMDTPQGLVVPVIRDVGSLNVLSIASELTRLQGLAHQGKLSPRDLTGGTITVSNIGNIGGTYLSPVIVEREVAILGVGRMRTVPAFDENDNVVKKQVCNFSWSADHRVVDGATMARAADVVRSVVEEPDVMVMHLR